MDNRSLLFAADPEAYFDDRRRHALAEILHYVRVGQKEGRRTDFRSLVDDWYGYYKRRPFINSRGKPHWFNRSDLIKVQLRDAIKRMHFISADAWQVIHQERENKRDHLVKDHAIPLAVLKDELKVRNDLNEESVEQFLIDRYRLGVITKTEDRRFSCESYAGIKLIHKMPPNDCSEFARYRATNIRRSEEHLKWLYQLTTDSTDGKIS